jgi:hypothetical protein
LCKILKVSFSYSRNRPWKPIGLYDVEDPTLSGLKDGGKFVNRTRRPSSIFLLLVLISVRGRVIAGDRKARSLKSLSALRTRIRHTSVGNLTEGRSHVSKLVFPSGFCIQEAR